ncbi:MAG: hypothetical protein ACE5E6_04815 [Phycisphaerae bacterium]
MVHRFCAGAVVLLLAGPAWAGTNVRVALRHQTPGPFHPGQAVTIDVEVENDTSKSGGPVDIPAFRIAQFDFSNNPDVVLVSFAFDTSALPGGGDDAQYTFDETFGSDGIVRMDYNFDFDNGGTFDLPGTLTKIGEVELRLPLTPGVVIIDAINVTANTPGEDDGAFFRTGFGADEVNYENFRGSLNGVLHDPLVVVTGIPTVSTWGAVGLGALLLVIGSFVFARRRPAAA